MRERDDREQGTKGTREQGDRERGSKGARERDDREQGTKGTRERGNEGTIDGCADDRPFDFAQAGSRGTAGGMPS